MNKTIKASYAKDRAQSDDWNIGYLTAYLKHHLGYEVHEITVDSNNVNFTMSKKEF